MGGATIQTLERVYYDTPDLRLTTAGVQLWRSETGWRAVFPTGREVGVAAPANAVPSELTDLLVAYVGGCAVAPCAHVTTERARGKPVDGDNPPGEVVRDDVSARGLGRCAGHTGTWRTVRTEQQVAGDADRDDGNLASFLGVGPGRPIDGGSSVVRVLTGYVGRQVDALRAADVELRLGEPDAVHDLRVAARRLRSCMRGYRRYFVSSRVAHVAAELAWLSGLLGAVRDREVLREQTEGRIRALPGELVLGPVQSEVDRLLARPEADAAQALRAELAGRRYLDLLAALARLRSDPPCRGRARRRASAALPRQIAKAYQKAATAVATADHTAAGPERDAALHGVRKKVRRLRYACEVAAPAVGKPAKRLTRHAKRLQSTLGDHHDAVVARPVLRQLGATAHLDGANGFTFGVVHGQLDELAAEQEAGAGRQWRRLAGSPARRKLAG